MSFNLIPVTKKSFSRAHADLSATYSEKRGLLTIIMSPAFLEAHQPALAVGAKVLCGWDSEQKRLAFIPTGEEQKPNSRLICKRASWEGAGHVIIPARNLPEDMPLPEQMTELTWADEADGAVSMPF